MNWKERKEKKSCRCCFLFNLFGYDLLLLLLLEFINSKKCKQTDGLYADHY